MKNAVVSLKAPAAIGPYSQAVEAGGFIYCSGQIGVHPKDGTLVSEDIGTQTEQVIKNLGHVLESAGLGLDNVVKTTVYMSDLSEFSQMNEVYARLLKKPYPARATIQVAKLPKGAKVEIEAVAVRS